VQSPTLAVTLLLMLLVSQDADSGLLLVSRTALSLLAIGYLPGLYIVASTSLSTSESRILYSVGLSIVCTLLFGFLLSAVYLGPISAIAPLSTPAVLLYLTVLALAPLVTGFDPLTDRLEHWYESVATWPQPYLLGGGLICSGFLGAYYVNNEMGRELLIGVILFTAVVAAAVVRWRMDRPVRQFLAYAVAATLLVQNLALTPFLARTGDTGFEYYFANMALTNQFWDPSIYSTKSTSLFLNVFYPFVRLFTGLDLFDVFLYVYPLLFALVAVALFNLHSKRFGATIAVTSVFLYVYTDQFFTLLSRSTRSGTAILFILLMMLALQDRELVSSTRRRLATVFLLSITTIHYGTAIVFAIVLAIAYGVMVLTRLFDSRDTWPLKLHTLVLNGLFLSVWFMYTSSGRTFDIAVFNIYLITRRTSQGQTDQSKTVQVATQELPSVTSTLIRVEYFFVVLIASVVVGILLLLYLYRAYSAEDWGGSVSFPGASADFRFDSTALAFPIGGLGLIALSFAPTSIFWINRLYMLTAVFVLPYFVVGLIALSSRLPTGRLRPSDGLAMLTVFILLLNTGVAGTMMFGEFTHQDTIDKNRIETTGEDLDRIQLYVNYYPPSDYYASTWLTQRRTANSTVYGVGEPISWLSYFSYTESDTGEPPGPYEVVNPEMSDGYVYINKFIGRTIDDRQTAATADRSSRLLLPPIIRNAERCDRVYSNGGSAVHTTTCPSVNLSSENVTTVGR
jgi:uncharacterized membrane protein